MAEHEFIFDSIGSRFWLERLDNQPFSSELKTDIYQYATRFDDAYSRFKDTSLVAQLARDGVLYDPPQELLDMLDYSKRMFIASGGAFNITVGAALHKLGYGKREHGGDVLADPWGHMAWSTDTVTAPKGLMLDFGGFGKGWMIDAISDILRSHGVERFVVNGGGDLYVQNSEPVEFALENPLQPGIVLRTIAMTKGALAGSDTLKRAWDNAGVQKHHIIDPVSGDSSHGDVVASYVSADSALVADTLATIAIINPALKPRLAADFHADIMLLTN